MIQAAKIIGTGLATSPNRSKLGKRSRYTWDLHNSTKLNGKRYFHSTRVLSIDNFDNAAQEADNAAEEFHAGIKSRLQSNKDGLKDSDAQGVISFLENNQKKIDELNSQNKQYTDHLKNVSDKLEETWSSIKDNIDDGPKNRITAKMPKPDTKRGREYAASIVKAFDTKPFTEGTYQLTRFKRYQGILYAAFQNHPDLPQTHPNTELAEGENISQALSSSLNESIVAESTSIYARELLKEKKRFLTSDYADLSTEMPAPEDSDS